MDKKTLKLLLAAGLIFVLFMIFAYFASNSLLNNNTFNNTQRQIKGDTGLDLDTDPTLIKKDQQSSSVMSLLNKTPYYGENFAFSYNYDENYFILYVNPQNPQAGNTEFDNFLKENGVDSRSSIYDLRLVTQKPTQ